jgi:hypothetical protein
MDYWYSVYFTALAIYSDKKAIDGSSDQLKSGKIYLFNFLKYEFPTGLIIGISQGS